MELRNDRSKYQKTWLSMKEESAAAQDTAPSDSIIKINR